MGHQARPSLARHWLATGTLRPLFTLTAPAANPYVLLPHVEAGAAGLFARWLKAECARAQADATEWLSGLG